MSSALTTCPTTALRLTVLVENTSPGPHLVAEHGFAAVMETDRGMVLFDTGASGTALLANAEALGVALWRTQAIVLSHGHHDHTGGLASALSAAPQARVHLHPRSTARRWTRRRGPQRPIGMPDDGRAALARAACRFVEQPQVLAEGLLVSGPVPGPAAPSQEGFVVEAESGPAADDFADEMFGLARTRAGWVLVTGCCHRGLRNTLALALRLSGGEPIRTVVGGLHLKGQPPASLEAAAAAMERAGTTDTLIGHCTGETAVAFLAARCAARVEAMQVGSRKAW